MSARARRAELRARHRRVTEGEIVDLYFKLHLRVSRLNCQCAARKAVWMVRRGKLEDAIPHAKQAIKQDKLWRVFAELVECYAAQNA